MGESSLLGTRLSEESKLRPGYCVLPYQQAAPAAYNQSWGWMAGQAGSLEVLWAGFPVGKFFDGVCELNVQTVQPVVLVHVCGYSLRTT